MALEYIDLLDRDAKATLSIEYVNYENPLKKKNPRNAFPALQYLRRLSFNISRRHFSSIRFNGGSFYHQMRRPLSRDIQQQPQWVAGQTFSGQAFYASPNAQETVYRFDQGFMMGHELQFTLFEPKFTDLYDPWLLYRQ